MKLQNLLSRLETKLFTKCSFILNQMTYGWLLYNFLLWDCEWLLLYKFLLWHCEWLSALADDGDSQWITMTEPSDSMEVRRQEVNQFKFLEIFIVLKHSLHLLKIINIENKRKLSILQLYYLYLQKESVTQQLQFRPQLIQIL